MFLVVMTQLLFDLDEFLMTGYPLFFADAFEKQVQFMFQERYRTVFWRATDLYSLMFAGV